MSTPDKPNTRICRKCSTASTVQGHFCPNCGTAYTRRSRKPSRKIVLVAIMVLLAVGGAATALLVKSHNDAVDRDRAAAAVKAAAVRQAEQAVADQEEADEAERSSRRELVAALEKRITKHAKGLVKEDLLAGPIKYSSCTATGGGSTDDLTALTGTFECLAVNKENGDGTASGYSYAGTAEWATGSISWKLGG